MYKVTIKFEVPNTTLLENVLRDLYQMSVIDYRNGMRGPILGEQFDKIAALSGPVVSLERAHEPTGR